MPSSDVTGALADAGAAEELAVARISEEAAAVAAADDPDERAAALARLALAEGALAAVRRGLAKIRRLT